MDSDLIRSITCFDSSNDELIFEVYVQIESLDFFRTLWKIGEDNEMYNCYKIERYQLPHVKKLIPESIAISWDTDKYSYFLECSSRGPE